MTVPLRFWPPRRTRNTSPALRRPAGPPGQRSAPAATRNDSPAWATQPTATFPTVGRAGWLTPAQTWRANGGRW